MSGSSGTTEERGGKCAACSVDACEYCERIFEPSADECMCNHVNNRAVSS